METTKFKVGDKVWFMEKLIRGQPHRAATGTITSIANTDEVTIYYIDVGIKINKYIPDWKKYEHQLFHSPEEALKAQYDELNQQIEDMYDQAREDGHITSKPPKTHNPSRQD